MQDEYQTKRNFNDFHHFHSYAHIVPHSSLFAARVLFFKYSQKSLHSWLVREKNGVFFVNQYSGLDPALVSHVLDLVMIGRIIRGVLWYLCNSANA